MELAVRTTGGQLVDPLTTSTYRLNSMHDEANAKIDKNMVSTTNRQGIDSILDHNRVSCFSCISFLYSS
jgi:hypothetical protein